MKSVVWFSSDVLWSIS